METFEIKNENDCNVLRQAIVYGDPIEHIGTLIINEGFTFTDIFDEHIDSDIEAMNNVKNLPIDFIDCSKVKKLDFLFSYFQNLKTIPKLIKTENVVSVHKMFTGCVSLESVQWFDTRSVKDFSSMFEDCYSLTSVPHFNLESAVSTFGMFSICRELKTVPAFNMKNVKVTSFMFFHCISLTYVPEFEMPFLKENIDMFWDCKSLKNIPKYETYEKYKKRAVREFILI